MAEHLFTSEDMGADEPGTPLWRRSIVDRERRRLEADGAADRLFSDDGAYAAALGQGSA